MSNEILRIYNLVEGVVVKRPSIYIKSPYVADIKISKKNNIDIDVLAHTPSLGCCGLVEKNATILLSPNISKKSNKVKPKNKANMKCSYTIYLAVYRDNIREKTQIIGIHPKISEILVENAIKNNKLSKLLNVRRYHRETTIFVKDKINSRFDFTGLDQNGLPFIMEVKNVPLADYEDISEKSKLVSKINYDGRDFDTKVAYFPDGYRKTTKDTVSPRALKHIEELTLIKRESKIRCIMCYVIQRTDINRFQPSVIDTQYRNAVEKAIEAGVEIITLVINWVYNEDTQEAIAYFVRDDLPITAF